MGGAERGDWMEGYSSLADPRESRALLGSTKLQCECTACQREAGRVNQEFLLRLTYLFTPSS